MAKINITTLSHFAINFIYCLIANAAYWKKQQQKNKQTKKKKKHFIKGKHTIEIGGPDMLSSLVTQDEKKKKKKKKTVE